MKRDNFVSENVGGLAGQALNNDPVWYLGLFTVLSFLGMIGAGLVDVALNYSVMSASMADAVTGETVSSPAVWFGSAVMLVGYWGLGVLYARSFDLRRFALGGYVAMVVVLMALLMPVQGPRFAEMWSGAVGSSPFGGGQVSPMPYPLLLAMVALTALLYSGPGLFFIWSKGRFVHWVEKCRNRSQAKKVLKTAAARDTYADAAMVKSVVIDHFAEAEMQVQTVRAVVRQAVDAYLAAVEIREREAKAVLGDIQASKALKREAEGELLAVEACKTSVSLVNF